MEIAIMFSSVRGVIDVLLQFLNPYLKAIK